MEIIWFILLQEDIDIKIPTDEASADALVKKTSVGHVILDGRESRGAAKCEQNDAEAKREGACRGVGVLHVLRYGLREEGTAWGLGTKPISFCLKGFIPDDHG